MLRGGEALVACTIGATNYVPQIRALTRSFLRHHPGGRFVCLIVDDPLGVIGQGELFEVLPCSDIGLSESEFRSMSLYYDVMEFSTALKPWVLETLLGQTSSPVIYLDPDCYVFDSLVGVVESARVGGIALTPHLLHPMPRDGMLPDERHILQSGVFNLGFIGLGHGSAVDQFLQYWKERLRFDAVVDPTRMLFTDQRWIDFVPGLFPHVIVRDPGCNVAYWNAHERDLHILDGRVVTSCGPLRFFHFSGFRWDEPHLLSRHTGERPRLLLSEHPILRELCRAYMKEVNEQDNDDLRRSEYVWSSLPNGIRIDSLTRALVRRACSRWRAG